VHAFGAFLHASAHYGALPQALAWVAFLPPACKCSLRRPAAGARLGRLPAFGATRHQRGRGVDPNSSRPAHLECMLRGLERRVGRALLSCRREAHGRLHGRRDEPRRRGAAFAQAARMQRDVQPCTARRDHPFRRAAGGRIIRKIAREEGRRAYSTAELATLHTTSRYFVHIWSTHLVVMEVGNLELPKSPAVRRFGIQSYNVTSPQRKRQTVHTRMYCLWWGSGIYW
jgi:hypothetical protein